MAAFDSHAGFLKALGIKSCCMFLDMCQYEARGFGSRFWVSMCLELKQTAIVLKGTHDIV